MTCLFLHDPDNILHLLGNLVFLAAVGPVVENAVGPLKFFIVYVASGLAGVGAHWLVAETSGVGAPLIGASAAIAGSVGYCTVRFSRRVVPLAPRLRVTVGALAVVWIALQAIGSFVKFGDSSGTSYVSHIGGFLGGLALAFVLRAQVAANAEAGRERIEVMSERSPAAALAAADEHLKDHPDDATALWEKAAALHAMSDREHEAEVLLRLIKQPGEQQRALECLAIIDRLDLLTPIERMRYAELTDSQTSEIILVSVLNEPDSEPERPNALLALIERGSQNRQEHIQELVTKYQFHSATEVARAKGLLQ